MPAAANMPASASSPATRGPRFDWGHDPSGTPISPADPPVNGGMSPGGNEKSAAQFIAELAANYPWLREMGIDPVFLQGVAAEASGPDEILVRLRQLPAYQARFPGMYRANGSVRMNEAQYLAREVDYRSLLRQYGYDVGSDYSSPTSLVGFFSGELDPNELRSRLDTYQKVEQSSQAQKDAFYVYAGIDISTEDLYAAAVDPAANQRLQGEYNLAIAAGKFDYQTFITRATEVGNRRVADALTVLSSRGAVTAQAVQTVMSISPDFARQIMDSIYTGGDPNNVTSTLSLNELLSSFEYAAVGAAATQTGLDLPTRERLGEIRAAGVEMATAADAYRNLGQNYGAWNAASLRTGGGGLTQNEFENAAFFGEGSATRELQQAVSSEEAAGKSVGDFRFSEENGRLTQRGFGR